MNDLPPRKNDLPPRPSLIFVGLAIVACGALWFINYHFLVGKEIGDRGTFGDMFGAVNSVFTGLAFVGLVYANLQQRHAIEIARKEARDTQKILSQQQLHLEQQNQEAKKQSFENTFFQLLRILTELTESMDLLNKNGTVTKGKDVFPRFVGRIKNLFTRIDQAHLSSIEKYEAFYRQHNTQLGHYFRTLYNTLKFVDESDVGNKKFYTNIVRAQLSDAEIAVLFYNCASSFGYERMRPLSERYNLLKNLNDKDVYDTNLWNSFPLQLKLRAQRNH